MPTSSRPGEELVAARVAIQSRSAPSADSRFDGGVAPAVETRVEFSFERGIARQHLVVAKQFELALAGVVARERALGNLHLALRSSAA